LGLRLRLRAGEFGDGGEVTEAIVDDELFNDVRCRVNVVRPTRDAMRLRVRRAAEWGTRAEFECTGGAMRRRVRRGTGWAAPGREGGCGGGQAGGGGLEAVEKNAGAFGVELVDGNAGEDAVEGEQEAGAVVDSGDGEGGGAVGAAGGGGRLLAGAMVVVAEVLSAEGGRAAAVAVGEDVTAEVAAAGVGRVDDFDGRHVAPPWIPVFLVRVRGGTPLPPYFGPKVPRGKGLSLKKYGCKSVLWSQSIPGEGVRSEKSGWA